MKPADDFEIFIGQEIRFQAKELAGFPWCLNRRRKEK